MDRRQPQRIRLDQLLVERGFFQDVKTAQGWIMAGSVIVDEVRKISRARWCARPPMFA